jgi:trigger factor
MNIVKENIDGLNAILKVQISKDDYESKVEKALSDYRKKATMPGFRPGKVPASLISKMYKKPILLDEINKLVSESISKYISDEKLPLLGEPLPNEQQNTIDFDEQTDFEFLFDIGLSPELDIQFSQKDKFNLFKIKVDDKMVDDAVENHCSRYGSVEDTTEIEKNAIIKGSLLELNEEGTAKEGGLFAEQASIYLNLIPEEEVKAQFDGKKLNDTIDLDLKRVFPYVDEIAKLFKITKEQADNLQSKFRLTITSLTKFVDAEINQQLFDNVYGPGNITSIEDFRKRIADDLTESYEDQSEYKFLHDLKETIIEKNPMELPNDFLKRWLFSINQGKFSKEDIDKDFHHVENDLKWQLIKSNIVKNNNLEVSLDELKQFARVDVIHQFRHYGLVNVPEEQISSYAESILAKEDERNKLMERKMEYKIADFIKSVAKIVETETSVDEFRKLLENKEN